MSTKSSTKPGPGPAKAALKKAYRAYQIGGFKLRSALAGVPEETFRVFSAGGGHGSSFMIKAIRDTGREFAVRPDNALANEEGWIPKTLDDRPEPESIEKFRVFTGFTMDPGVSINDNFLAYLEFLEEHNRFALFSRISRVGPFLTRNGISRAICLVRHPLHAYVSYIAHQHPEAAEHLGDIESPERVAWYAEQWNKMTLDYLDAGAKIIRYEFLTDDVAGVESPPLPKLLAGWRTGKRNHGVLSKKNEDFLRELVAGTYDRLYDRWDV